MRLIDIYPTQGFTRPGEAVTLIAEVDNGEPGETELLLQVQHLAEQPVGLLRPLRSGIGVQRIELTIDPPRSGTGGYGVEASLVSRHGPAGAPVLTAFDILPDWTAYPRYGFLSDFAPQRSDLEDVFDRLARYHVNGLQFYDWQYRHDSLVAPASEYIDPLGRPLSLETVRALIDGAHRHGMAAMPYLAIYAASAAFWRDHRDWSLRDATGMPIPFGDDFLGLMDPSPGASWAGHLMGECARALSELPFDGLHIDQYGEPKLAWNARAEPVDLPAAFAAFVAAAKARFPGRTVLFNAVGNWPIEALAPSATDFNYIEVWPPRTRFGHLAEIVRDARRLSGGKPVVIALYLPANRPATVLLADALILACGGARIELGEGDRLLADPYFPNHQALSLELSRSLRRFYDFAVRYGEWIGPAAEDVDELIVELPAEIRAVGRAAAGRLILHLINFTGLDPDPSWDQAQPFPSAVREVGVRIRLRAGPERVWWATPEEPRVQSLPFRYEDGWLSFEAPALAIWGFAAIEGG